ncbi:MAG TPA: hypothetical protein VFL14_03000 [Xanthomonadales bacterium]|nr:hypothetical protein [Xanthomonadales bacterium]
MSLRTKFLHAAIASALCVPMPHAGAVSLDSRGTGQVLLYPYYTVNAGNQTLLSVVNTTNRAKAVKVRFLEARNSKQALGFSVYLGPFDTWTAAVFASSATGPASIVTFDGTCTVPQLQVGQPQAFNAFAYSGASSDHPPALDATLSAPERTREGHIEMIEMGLLQTGPGATELAEESYTVNGGASNCPAIVAQWQQPGGGWLANPAADIDAPNGGLIGAASIVDVEDGLMLSYRAEALRDFYTNAAAPGALHAEPLGPTPNLASADNGGGFAEAKLDVPGVGVVTERYALPTSRPDAVSLVLMQDRVLNEFNVDPALDAGTEGVVTFPTKRFYTDVATNAETHAPFTDAFRDDGVAREQIQRDLRDREGRAWSLFTDGVCPPDFDPPRPSCATDFGSAVNVLEFSGGGLSPNATATEILGSPLVPGNADRIITQSTSNGVFASGWGYLRFEDAGSTGVENRMTGPTTGLVYRGLPAIGFGVLRVINGNALPGILANYGGAYRHRGTVSASAVDP